MHTLRSEPGAAAKPAGVEDAREDISRRMYAGHDMSSHEVVVRSLLEMLQEFDDASEGDRSVRTRDSSASRCRRAVAVFSCFLAVFLLFQAEAYCLESTKLQ